MNRMNGLSKWFLLFGVIVCTMIGTMIWREWQSYSMLVKVMAEDTAQDNQTTEEVTTEEPTTEATTKATTEEPTTEEPKPVFGTAPEGYFEDALFIGDSRTEGLEGYGDIKEATYFASTGMSVHSYHKERDYISGIGTVSLETLLQKQTFGKVYILLGINELGAGPEIISNGIQGIIDLVHTYQPEALVCVQANMHVTKKKNDSHRTFTNANINALNEALANLADGEKVFYLDMNPYYDDEYGNMLAEYSYDGIHLKSASYQIWTQCLREQAIIFQ